MGLVFCAAFENVDMDSTDKMGFFDYCSHDDDCEGVTSLFLALSRDFQCHKYGGDLETRTSTWKYVERWK